MKFCSKCGKELIDEAVVCIGCGCSVANTSFANDKRSLAYALIGFFFPIVGLIIWLMWKDSSPLKAKSAGKGALISVILGVAVSLIISIL